MPPTPPRTVSNLNDDRSFAPSAPITASNQFTEAPQIKLYTAITASQIMFLSKRLSNSRGTPRVLPMRSQLSPAAKLSTLQIHAKSEAIEEYGESETVHS